MGPATATSAIEGAVLRVVANQTHCWLPMRSFDRLIKDAIRAIPGRRYDLDHQLWSLRLTPDRAWSVLNLARATDAFVEEATQEILDAFIAERDSRHMDLEVVQPERDGPWCVSLCRDWTHLERAAIEAAGYAIDEPAIERRNITLTPLLARELLRIDEQSEHVRVSNFLRPHVEQLSRNRAATTPPAPQGARTRFSVRFESSARTHLYFTGWDVDALAAHLPDAELIGASTLVAPATPATGRAMVGLTQRAVLQPSPAVEIWLRNADRFQATISVGHVDEAMCFLIVGNGGTPPGCLLAAPFVADGADRWWLPGNQEGQQALSMLLSAQPDLAVDPTARSCLAFLVDNSVDDVPPAVLELVEDDDGAQHFLLRSLWADGLADDIAAVGEQPRRRRATADQSDAYAIVADPSSASSVQDLVASTGASLADAARQLLGELVAAHKLGEELVALSRADDADLDVPGLAHELMPFQVAGVAYALRQRRVLLADEQGLGKTIQALAAVEADDAYPAIVVVPASLKLNWCREIERWLPARRAQRLRGRANVDLTGDIIVLNYELVDAHREALKRLGPRALILDESHYCKNPSAARTQALTALSHALDQDALRLALTGTPVVNRPRELVPQLRILGRLEDFGSGALFTRRFGTPEAQQRLHWHLRSRCYVRHLKADVLPQLPAKRRSVIPVELSNEAEYREAEADFIAWLHGQCANGEEFRERVTLALRAQALTHINALRGLAGAGKLAAAAEWIEAFLSSGEKLVVFTHHRAQQDALVKRFPTAARILGSDPAHVRDENVQRLQDDPDVSLCVCSLKAAAHGLTLTAAANVAFVEMGWTPAEHDQAEDRCHRIGQRDAVSAWYLLAADTIDERMAAIVERKRRTVDAITDGRETDNEASMVDALLESYLSGDREHADAAVAL